MTKLKKIEVQSIEVGITKLGGEDYICITDMAQAKSDATRAADVKKTGLEPEQLSNFRYVGKNQ